jgi:rod shape-determining protein MreC
MRFLFIFLKKQSFFLLFIFLEFIAILLLVNHNNYHKTSILNSGNIITGSFYSVFSSIGDYFSLKKANQQLSEENALLLNVGISLSQASDSSHIKDTTYRFIPARVISNNTRNRNNYIMINKGRSHGVEKEMGLVSPAGIAGIIINVSENYSIAMSLLHKDTRISARLKSNGQMVDVSWDGVDYKKGIIENIPSHIIPRHGDIVITSGYSFVFPENIIIGTIGEKIEQGGSLNRAELYFSTDFNNLYYVYVTENLVSAELDSLEIDVNNE